jgi:molybdate transport system regulatory protein
MKISARNMLQGKVTAVRKGAINAEVELSLPGNQKIVAVITNGSLENLELVTGSEAYALIKAPLVLLAQDIGGMKFSTRNILEGTVRKVEHGTVNAEVGLELAGGLALSSIVTEQSVAAMGLKEGDKAVALFKASSVILAVQG